MKIVNIIIIGIVCVVLIGMYSPFMEKIRESRLDINNCLEEESYYYRIEQGLIFSSKVQTTEDKSDGIDYRCIDWEEEVSIGKIILGQELVYEKGSLDAISREDGK